MNLLIRYGPAPGDTEDIMGRLHASFTGFFILPLSTKEINIIFGTDPELLVNLIRQIWQQITTTESNVGHILIGTYSCFEYITDGSTSCGFQIGTSIKGVPFIPKNYVPLYAVARNYRSTDYIDLAIDYRNTKGPGDETIRPIIF